MAPYCFPHHGDRSFTVVQDDVLPSYTGIMDSAAERSSLAHAVRLRILACRNDSNHKRIFSLQLTAHYRLPHHDSRSFTFVQDDVLPSYTRTMESAAGRSSLAHAVRLRILACRNDSNHKRIFSLQLTAHS